jgi:hypothetical protein
MSNGQAGFSDFNPVRGRRSTTISGRAFSSKELVQHTKTHKQHVIPCHPDFKPMMEKMPITFKPINRDFEPIELTCEDEGSVEVVAEMLEVLG